jgi:excisionase family DNA binding protein
MAFKTTDDPRIVPAYSVAEAAHYLRMPEGTLRSWVARQVIPGCWTGRSDHGR